MQPNEVTSKRILLSPLNWGMGHVSRCIGLINELRQNKNTIIIACCEDQQKIFESYFDDLKFASHRGYPFNFKGKGNYTLDLLRKSLSLFKRHKSELQEVADLVDEHNIDIVISDHRYGFRSEVTPSIFITHQLNLPVLLHEQFMQWIHKRLVKKFNEVWVMDYTDGRLGGNLSKNNDLFKTTYIGPYSRFQLYEIDTNKNIDEVLVASGPDVYAKQLIDMVSKDKSNLVIISKKELDTTANNQIVNGWLEQDQVLMKAKKIISRSGYSTIMDLEFLKVEAELIPTKGQREQIYLSQLYNQRK